MKRKGHRIRMVLASGLLSVACLTQSPAAAWAAGTGTLQIAVTSEDAPKTDDGSLVLSVSNGTKTMNIHLSGKNGTYKQDLPDGSYTVKTLTYTAKDGSTPDITDDVPETFVIEDGSSTSIKLSFDVKDDGSAASAAESDTESETLSASSDSDSSAAEKETPKASPSPIVKSADSGTDSDTESIVSTTNSSKPISETSTAETDANKSFWLSLLKKNLIPLLALGVCLLILGVRKLMKKKQVEEADRAEDQEIENEDAENVDDGDFVNDAPEDDDEDDETEEEDE